MRATTSSPFGRELLLGVSAALSASSPSDRELFADVSATLSAGSPSGRELFAGVSATLSASTPSGRELLLSVSAALSAGSAMPSCIFPEAASRVAARLGRLRSSRMGLLSAGPLGGTAGR
jgi:hypothetical protein